MQQAVSVIVPTFNGAPMLSDLLASLERQTVAHEVVVVDNGSTDGTAALLRERFPHVRLVELDENVGFGRATNRGVSAADGDVLVFVNNDVVCEPGFVERLVAALDPPRNIAMAAGVLVQARDPDRIDTAGIEFDCTLLAFDYLHGEPLSILANGVHDPLGPSAGAAAVDRAAFESVGRFDESFFAYLEDVDLVVRMLAAGAECRLATDAFGVHRQSATLGAGSRRKNELMSWSRGYMIGKYRLHRSPPLFARALATEALGVAAKLVLDRTPGGTRARVAGWRAGLATDSPSLPPPRVANDVSFVDAQRRRFRRRRARAATGAARTSARSSRV